MDLNDDDDQSPQLEPRDTASIASHLSLVKWLITFLFLLQAKFHLSDRVLDMLLKFLKTFFTVSVRFNSFCALIASEMPTSLYMARKKYRTMKDCFKLFPVCKDCGSVWKFDSCIEGHGAHRKAKLCPYKSPFGKHRRSQKCNAILLKTQLKLPQNVKYFIQ